MSWLEAWQLFGAAWVGLALAATALALPGTLVVAGGQALAGISAVQVALTAAAAALACGAMPHGWLLPMAAVLGAGLGGLGLLGANERVSLWLAAAGFAAPGLLVAASPYGANEVQALALSRLLGLDWLDTGLLLLPLGLGLVLLTIAHRPLRLLILDSGQLAVSGAAPWRWRLLLGLWTGLAIGFGLRALGAVAAIAFVLLPGLAALACCQRFSSALRLAPCLALLAVGLALPLAHYLDQAPALIAAAVIATFVPFCWLLGAVRR